MHKEFTLKEKKIFVISRVRKGFTMNYHMNNWIKMFGIYVKGYLGNLG